MLLRLKHTVLIGVVSELGVVAMMAVDWEKGTNLGAGGERHGQHRVGQQMILDEPC
jgi:hypothetical protein